MKYKVILIFVILILLGVNNIIAQEKESAAKPLELPNFIIEGKEQLNVRSGIKQYPDKPKALGKYELDSINTLEKKLPLMLPVEQMPDRILFQKYNKGFLTGQFGRYTTANIGGGYEFLADGYDLFGFAGADLSNGPVQNAEYKNFNLDLFADYNADEKFLIFGGSRTRTNLSFANNNYNLYAVQSAPNRNLMNLGLKLETDGNYEGAIFSTGFGLKTLQLSQDSMKTADNGINGFISIKSSGRDFDIGGDAFLDLQSLRGDGIYLFSADGFTSFVVNDMTFNIKLGFQGYKNSMNIWRSGLLLSGDIDYKLNQLFTIKGNISTGLAENSFYSLMSGNPYLDGNVIVDYAYNLPSVKAIIYYHPDEELSFSGGFRFVSADRTPVFVNSDSAEFGINYSKVNTIEGMAEGNFKLTSNDNFVLNLIIGHSSLNSSGKIQPYTSPLNLSIDYNRSWDESFGTQIGIIYISERYTDLANDNKLPASFNLRIKADYWLNNNFKIFADLENLLNSDMFVWNGYKERGLFISAGILWQF